MAGESVDVAARVAFVCPRCRGVLERREDAYRCDPCAARYPIVLGIADFRLAPDPWIGLEEDREKARRLADRTSGLDFAETVRAYWAMTPETPRALAERFTARVLDAEARAEAWLDSMPADERVLPEHVWLDVGCGTAALGAAIARRGGSSIGVDVAFRWLYVAQRRPSLARSKVVLVCANGEHLPFAARSVDHVTIAGTLEHCGDPGAVVSEGARVLVSGGSVRVRSVNRYSLLREPHVGLWGVGLVPRRWADAFVRWRSGQRYEHHRPLSRRELGRDLNRAGFARVGVRAAPLLASDRPHLHGVLRLASGFYQRARALPVLGAGLAWIAPELEAHGRAR